MKLFRLVISLSFSCIRERDKKYWNRVLYSANRIQTLYQHTTQLHVHHNWHLSKKYISHVNRRRSPYWYTHNTQSSKHCIDRCSNDFCVCCDFVFIYSIGHFVSSVRFYLLFSYVGHMRVSTLSTVDLMCALLWCACGRCSDCLCFVLFYFFFELSCVETKMWLSGKLITSFIRFDHTSWHHNLNESGCEVFFFMCLNNLVVCAATSINNFQGINNWFCVK